MDCAFGTRSISILRLLERVFSLANATAVYDLETLFTTLEGPLLTYARRLTDSEASAQDLVQEAFLRLHHFSPVASPKAWLYRTIHNMAVDQGKRSARQRVLSAEHKDTASEDEAIPNEALEQQETLGLVRLVLEELDARTRTLIKLKFEDGLSYREIAEQTNLSVSNVGYLLHHAIRRIADEFDKRALGK